MVHIYKETACENEDLFMVVFLGKPLEIILAFLSFSYLLFMCALYVHDRAMHACRSSLKYKCAVVSRAALRLIHKLLVFSLLASARAQPSLQLLGAGTLAS